MKADAVPPAGSEGSAPSGLAPGRYLELPGRGVTFVREAHGPAGAPTVLLLHGLAATGGLNWFAAFPTLRDRYHVLCMDHRGHGRGIRSGRPFSLEDCADDVIALADELGIDRFVAVGYSMGGPISQLAWRRHHDRVAGLVLCATARNFRATRTATLLSEALPATWVAANVGPGGFARAVGVIWTRRREESPLVVWAARELSRSSPFTVLQAVRALSRFSSHEWIEQVDVPTAVVVTMRDRLVPPSRQLKLAQAIPGASVHPVQGDHFAVGATPSVFMPAFVEAVGLVMSKAHLV